ncbi:hypothetical protein CTZ27_31520 [Streptomyces griseocarneus]|nr:hypothetical protein CTZ27_31520 [Streptomyces griseocarneus]
MSAKTFTTAAGATYAYAVETGEHGETVYGLSRVFTESTFPVGAVVLHPDYNLNPATPGLLNVQFGKSGADSHDRHDRTDVPVLGGQNDAYVIGHQLINPADLDTDPEADTDTGEIADPKIQFTRTVRAASAPTGAASVRATRETFERAQDLVTALVKLYRADKATPKREAQYAQFLNTQRAENIQPEIDTITAQINALMIRKAELTDKLNSYKTA